MLNYLIERENEEMLRTSVRTLAFPDGETRRIEAYRLVWQWFDRVIECNFGPTEEGVLDTTLKCATEEELELNEALGRVIEYYVRLYEESGMDFTDGSLELKVAHGAIQRFAERKAQRRAEKQ